MNEKLDFEEAKTVFLHNLDLLIFTNIVSEDLNASFIARKFCMSLSTLYRRMLRYAGCGVNEYIRNKRLDKAMSLLTNVYGGGQSLSISNAAYSCGFSTPASFSKAFRNRYGISMTKYLHQSRDLSSIENHLPSISSNPPDLHPNIITP